MLWRIIYSSDQCVGHRECDHSMQPWLDARTILFGVPPQGSSTGGGA